MRNLFPYIIIVVLGFSLYLSVTSKKDDVTEEKTSDTITLRVVDTVFYDKPVYVPKIFLDTIYVKEPSGDSLSLVLMQKYYTGSQYEAWVSGYNPSLDSLRVFNNTIVKTINNEIVRKVYPKTTDIYLNAGCMIIGGDFAPNIGASVKFRNNFKIGGSVGIYDRKPYYGISLGFKINDRK